MYVPGKLSKICEFIKGREKENPICGYKNFMNIELHKLRTRKIQKDKAPLRIMSPYKYETNILYIANGVTLLSFESCTKKITKIYYLPGSTKRLTVLPSILHSKVNFWWSSATQEFPHKSFHNFITLFSKLF